MINKRILMIVACITAVLAVTAQSSRGSSSASSGSRSASSGHDHTHTGAAGNIKQIATAWKPIAPLGLHEESTIDTLLYNYYQQAIPSAVSDAYATTGNTASPASI